MKKEKQKEVVGFDFQIIPLAEAQPLVLAGDGNYAELKAKILETLPSLQEDQAFTFGLPSKNGEVPEDQRRGICMALNHTLTRAGYNHYVTYTSIKKLFLVMPKNSKKSLSLNGSDYKPKSKWNAPDLQAKVRELRRQGLKPDQIAEETGMPLKSVKYIVYMKMKEEEAGRIRQNARPDIPFNTVEDYWKFAHDVFNVNAFTKEQRRAAITVGYRDLRLDPQKLGKIVGITKSGIRFVASYNGMSGKEEIETLRKAITKMGGKK